MRIVDRKTFLSLPPKTLYRKYQPQIYGDLNIKFDTLPFNDWINLETHGDIEGSMCCGTNSDLHSVAQYTGDTYRFDLDSCGRDGCYDDDQLFAVYDNEDIQQLIDKLKECLK